MIKKMYVDKGSGGGSKDSVDQLMGNEVTDNKGNLSYTETIPKFLPSRDSKSRSWSGMERPDLTSLRS